MDAPIWSKKFEEEAIASKSQSSNNGRVGGKDIYQLLREKQSMPYGSEKPITLCEAFINKYMSTKKDKVCMQIKRSLKEANHIYLNIYKGE